MRRWVLLVIAAVVAVGLAGVLFRSATGRCWPLCDDDTTTAAPAASVPTTVPGSTVEALGVEVVATHPHDPTAFTQGLLVDDRGRLIEGTGLEGRSELRVVDLVTGVPSESVELPDDLFGEGVTQAGDRFIQLTWKDQVALVWNAATLEQEGTLDYEGEGWGLCTDAPGTADERLVRSDGSPTLTFHDPDTFEETGTLDVDLDGQPVEELNELECVDGDVWANIWQTDTIVRIDLATGAVTGVVDAAGLLTPEEQIGADVLNGIAKVPGSDTFYLTGKLWPTLFEVRFVPLAASPSTSGGAG